MFKGNVISYQKPKSVVSEAFRALRTNLQFSMAKKNENVILITSSHVNEGKSSIAANLATVFALQKKKTVLIDADMRRGVQHQNFAIDNQNGLSNYLADMACDSKKLIKETGIENLYVITAGAVPPNPAELLSLEAMQELIQNLKELFDIVIIDGAPVLPVTDSVILAGIVDKVVLVASANETHKEEIKNVQRTLEGVNAKIAGVVLNKVEMPKKGYSKYGKYTGYSAHYYAEDNQIEDNPKQTHRKHEDTKASKK